MRGQSIHLQPTTHDDGSKTDLVRHDTSSLFETEDGTKHEQAYPPPWKVAMITVGLALAVFCLSLDNTILATAIPKITAEFNSLDDVGWYASSYLIATCGLSVLFGKLYTFYCIKWVYLAGLAIFEIGSLVCALAGNSTSLIIGRAISGIGAAGLFSGSLLIIAETIPLSKRALYTGLLTAVFGVAGVAGPLLGGAFTDYVSWRWCFYINLPLGGVTAVFISFFFGAKEPIKQTNGLADRLSQLDLISMSVFLPGTICLLLAIQWGGSEYEWSSGTIIGLFVAFGILISVFIALQYWRQERATVPPQLISNRNVWGSAAFAFCMTSSMMVLTYYLPIWFQTVKDASATKSGLMNLPMILGSVILAIISGAIVNVTGYYTPFFYMSPVIAALGAGLLTTLKTDSGSAQWIGYQSLYGIGLGMGMAQPTVAVQAALPHEDVPTAIVLVSFMQTFGGAVMVAVAQNIFQDHLVRNLVRDVPGLDFAKVVAAGATKLRDVVEPEMLPAVLEAYSSAITVSFYVGVAMAASMVFGALPIQWINVKNKATGGVPH